MSDALFTLHQAHPDTQALYRLLQRPDCGACVTFEGWVRNHHEGRQVQKLEYEAFAPLALAEGTRILAEARERFEVQRVRCAHRVGALAIGDLAVWVGVSSHHRGECFDACRYIIDEVKQRVPIWKKEYYENGDSGWVNCERCAAPQRSGIPHTHSHSQ